VSVAAQPAPIENAGAFGVIDAEADGRIRAFQEKPAKPPAMPGDPTRVLASMGNYVFSTEVLIDAVTRDAADERSDHDVGGDIITLLVGDGCAHVYDFTSQIVPGQSDRERGYWRDCGHARFLLLREHGPGRPPPRLRPV